MATIVNFTSRGPVYFSAGLLLFFILFNLAPVLHPSSSLAVCRLFTPQPPTIATRFEHFRKLEDLGPVGDRLWSSLVPEQGGLLWVATNSTKDLSDREGWGITMFHALHCLQMMREVFKLVIPEDQYSSGRHSHPQRLSRSGPHEHDMNPDHATHCFSYLYQVITCGADGTLEPPQRRFDTEGRQTDWVVNGAGVQHMCRDPRLLWEMVNKSETSALDRVEWKMGDTVWDVFG